MSFEKELTDNIVVDFRVGSRLERGRYERYQFDFIFNLFDFDHIKKRLSPKKIRTVDFLQGIR